jgi:hypothetical protein
VRLRRLVLAGAVAAAALVPAQPAAAEVFVAYGNGLTVCEIRVEQHVLNVFGFTMRAFGTTDCNTPVDQTSEATMGGNFDAPPCSGVTRHCYSGMPGEHEGFTSYYASGPWYGPLRYTVALRAPDGQGWLGAPTGCSGVGTDNLKCVFSVDLATGVTG